VGGDAYFDILTISCDVHSCHLKLDSVQSLGCSLYEIMVMFHLSVVSSRRDGHVELSWLIDISYQSNSSTQLV